MAGKYQYSIIQILPYVKFFVSTSSRTNNHKSQSQPLGNKTAHRLANFIMMKLLGNATALPEEALTTRL